MEDRNPNKFPVLSLLVVATLVIIETALLASQSAVSASRAERSALARRLIPAKKSFLYFRPSAAMGNPMFRQPPAPDLHSAASDDDDDGDIYSDSDNVAYDAQDSADELAERNRDNSVADEKYDGEPAAAKVGDLLRAANRRSARDPFLSTPHGGALARRIDIEGGEARHPRGMKSESNQIAASSVTLLDRAMVKALEAPDPERIAQAPQSPSLSPDGSQ